jgi:hypothetical protein
MAYEKQARRPLQHVPDVPPPHPLLEPLTINRRVCPKVAAMVHKLLQHHDRVAHTSVTSVVLSTHNGHVVLKVSSDLLA